MISVICTVLVAIVQPHTHTVFNRIDSALFGGLAIISILWSAGQSDHYMQVLTFFIPLLVMVVFVCWKAFKKPAFGGRLKACYFRCYRFQGIEFTELSAGNSGASAQERRPLLDKENSPNVPCTVVAITN